MVKEVGKDKIEYEKEEPINEDLIKIGNVIVDCLSTSSKNTSVFTKEVQKIMNKLPLP